MLVTQVMMRIECRQNRLSPCPGPACSYKQLEGVCRKAGCTAGGLAGAGKDARGNNISSRDLKGEKALTCKAVGIPAAGTLVQRPQRRNKYETFKRPKEMSMNGTEKARGRQLGKWTGAKPDQPSQRL